MSAPSISMGDAVADFCQQDAFTARALIRACDAIMVPCIDARYGGSCLNAKDFAVLEQFMAFIRPEFELADALRREQTAPDEIAISSDGTERLVLSGELA